MDPLAEEQLDYEDDEYGGTQKMQYQGGGAISALADDEMIGEDDEYDDLYNDVNVGEGLLQLQRQDVPAQPVGVNIGGFQLQKTNVSEPRGEASLPPQSNVSEVATEGNYLNAVIRFPEHKEGVTSDRGPDLGLGDISQKGRAPVMMTHDTQAGHLGFQGSTPMPQKIGTDPATLSGKIVGESTSLPNSGTGPPQSIPLMAANQIGMNINVNVNRPVVENQIRPAVENGGSVLFVGELHWWTTDADIENVLSQYGRVKEIKFFDERASGKSKGYCQVEFYDSTAASTCKEGMNGHVFNGRACVVAFASPQTMKQMGASYTNRTQNQPQSQPQGRRFTNDGAGRGGGMNFSGGDSGGRTYGRGGGWGRGGQGMPNRGPGGGPMRGRGGMGPKNMVGNTAGVGTGASGGTFGQGLAGPAFGGHPGGLMHPQGMMGTGFDPTYMGRGAAYGGFSGHAFHGMLPTFPTVNTMGLAGVAPHVNPAFFGRGMAANGMGMMGTAAMDAHHAGMWTDPSMGQWGGGEEHGRRTRESSYGGEDGASEYGHGEASYEKGARSSAAPREKERGSEREWSGNSEKRHRDDRERDREKPERDHRYREEKDGYHDHRAKENYSGYEDDYDKVQSSSRVHSRSRAMPEENSRSRSRDVDYGKRRRLPSE